MAERVFISGANGFIGSHTAEQLLPAGYEVVGSVRDPNNEKKTAHLTALPGAKERLTLVAADLTAADPFSAYVQDVDYVLHTASPYIINVKDPQKDLVDPAVQGTESMLKACANSSRIKRVIVTSSMAAMTDEPPEHVMTEADWNEKSGLKRNPYYYSKTLAEKAAWKFVEQQKPAWTLITINPYMVVGPSLSPNDVNESNQLLADLINGKTPAVIDLKFGVVDVRDVAKAHVLALSAENASGRYLTATDARSVGQMVELIRGMSLDKHKLPKMSLESGFGTGLMKLLSYTQPAGVGQALRTNLGRNPRFDNSKIRDELGIEFRDVDQSIKDTVNDLKRLGHIG